VAQSFGADRDRAALRAAIFSREVWLPLNRGELTVAEAKSHYVADALMTSAEADHLFETIIASMEPLPGSVPLMERLRASGYRVLALSDNVHEFVDHYKAHHDWWSLLDGAVISAELGIVKPDPAIYHALVRDWDVTLNEAVFMDDVVANVEGARATGLHAFQFTSADAAETQLAQAFGLSIA
jgi:putative hydrolase of the HAD superfamily